MFTPPLTPTPPLAPRPAPAASGEVAAHGFAPLATREESESSGVAPGGRAGRGRAGRGRGRDARRWALAMVGATGTCGALLLVFRWLPTLALRATHRRV